MPWQISRLHQVPRGTSEQDYLQVSSYTRFGLRFRPLRMESSQSYPANSGNNQWFLLSSFQHPVQISQMMGKLEVSV